VMEIAEFSAGCEKEAEDHDPPGDQRSRCGCIRPCRSEAFLEGCLRTIRSGRMTGYSEVGNFLVWFRVDQSTPQIYWRDSTLGIGYRSPR
jgi:hypothetical protein